MMRVKPDKLTKKKIKELLEKGKQRANGFIKTVSGERIEVLNEWQEYVLEFHKKFNCYIAKKVGIPPQNIKDVRKNLIQEEVFEELFKAIDEDNIEKVADGIGDGIVVLLGTAIAYGINMAPIIREIHKTNMAKDGGGKRADGKILKPKGWQPPDIFGELKKQGWES